MFIIISMCFKGSRPKYLGVKQGKLARCREAPNCVSSQAPVDDRIHYIDPISVSSSSSNKHVLTRIQNIFEGMDKVKIIRSNEEYLYAEFSSTFLGFVDDVEFYAEKEAVVHVRSASRLGYSDLGVNRNRIESIRSKLQVVDSKL